MQNIFPDILDKESYSYEDFSSIVNGYLSKQISELDMQSWIKYIFKRGMSINESTQYTKSIIDTGMRIDFSDLDAPIVDKHSTGGVGDKVSLVLGPLLAAYGYYVPMIVGTSLGHTGGTLDKLCSIPGYRPYLSIEDFKRNVYEIGISIMGQTEDICPGDKKIYELRDRMNMIDSYPLICGSIMSKKIAEGIDTLVLDIKTGNGAFMYRLDMAKNLGKLLKEIGELNDVKVQVAITDMSQPLGDYSGIACEVIESIEALKGNGPKDLMDVVYYLAEQIILMNEDDANHQKLQELINSGEAYQKFIDMVEMHGGSIEKFNQLNYQDQKFKHTLYADRDGYVKSFQTKRIGEILSSIGAGRLNNIDGIDNHSGLTILKKISNSISKGEPILEFYCSSEVKINNLKSSVKNLFEIAENTCKAPQLIYS
jgi:pyrimidine-nucleoside phosphorylase